MATSQPPGAVPRPREAGRKPREKLTKKKGGKKKLTVPWSKFPWTLMMRQHSEICAAISSVVLPWTNLELFSRG